MDINELIENGAKISIVLSLSDLRKYSISLIEETIKIIDAKNKAKQYLTQKEAADKLNVSENTLWRWNKIGYLKPTKVGNTLYYKLSDIEALYDKNKT